MVKKVIVVVIDVKKGVVCVIVDKEGYKFFIIFDNVGGCFFVLILVGLLFIVVVGFDIE